MKKIRALTSGAIVALIWRNWEKPRETPVTLTYFVFEIRTRIHPVNSGVLFSLQLCTVMSAGYRYLWEGDVYCIVLRMECRINDFTL